MLKHKRGYWNIEICRNKALNYTSRKEFQKKEKNAYAAALYYGWVDDVCSHMIFKIKPNNYWTKELCANEAKKYKSRSEFQKLNRGAYYRAMKNKWLDDICKHMQTIKRVEYGYWNKENCKNEALKYKTKREFKLKSNGAYDASKKNGWLEELSHHMVKLGNRYNKFIYGYFFDDGFAYVGLTYDRIQREKRRKFSKNDSVMVHKLKTGLTPKYIQLSELLSVDDAIKMEGFYYDKFKNEGWNMLNKTKTGSIGSGIKKWTYENTKLEAKKYRNRSEFQKNASGAYYSSYRNGWLNDFF